MQEKYNNNKTELVSLLENTILPEVKKFSRERAAYVNSILKIFEEWNNTLTGITENDLWWKETNKLYDYTEELLQKDKYKFSKFTLLEELEKFYNESQLISKVDKTNDELKELFELNNDETRRIKKQMLIGYLNNLFFIHLLKEIEIAFTKMGKEYLVIYDALIEFNYATYKNDNTAEDKINNAYKVIETKLPAVKKSLLSLPENFSEAIEKAESKIESMFVLSDEGISEVDTLLERFSTKELKKKEDTADKELKKFSENFKNYFLTIFDYREFLEDILWFNAGLRAEYFLVLKNFFETEKYLEKNVFNQIDGLIEKVKVRIEQSSKENLLAEIKDSKVSLLESINKKIIIEFINYFSIDDFSARVNNFLQLVEKNLSEFSKEYSFIKEDDLVFQLNINDITKFSPKDLITPIVMNKLENELDSISEDINADLKQLNKDIIAYSDMIEFNLESAESLYNENIGLADEARQLALEGLGRAKNRNSEFVQRFKDIGDQFENLFIEACENALDNLTDFIDIDKLLSIKLQASKEKAVQNVKDKFASTFESIKTFVKKDLKKNIRRFGTFKKKLVEISGKVGLTSEGLELSEELSKYLLKVSATLNNLPYIYKKIFENEPVGKEDLFIGRRDELAKFTWAYRRWMNDIPTSMLLVGEKGSGTSSTIIIAIKKIDPKIEVLTKEIDATIYKPTEVLNELKLLFNLEKAADLDDLIAKVNAMDSKKIVVMENIEDFFLKIVNGFEGIRALLRVISETNEKIFWISTCNVYTWKYFNSTINIDDSITTVLEFSELSKGEIEEIIMKRHNISGYKLKFLPSEEELNSSSFVKKTEEEKQKFLADEYFSKIKDLSPNNIAISLFFWLRSISDFKNNEIQISTDLYKDFSFLQLLSNDKLHTLAAMILHDGLTINEHALIFNMKEYSSKTLLMALEDSGIIFSGKTKYKINFQLYRPIINLLKNKNILH
ncbi:MAG: hypothetical protein HND52_10915 [Ignavibacteriae bacterium]|nr:hypothetical protein [Ignavibacteriota bacterium]NOG98459.1 hypothetical protein [Ignavibacteriota bacterium]